MIGTGRHGLIYYGAKQAKHHQSFNQINSYHFQSIVITLNELLSLSNWIICYCTNKLSKCCQWSCFWFESKFEQPNMLHYSSIRLLVNNIRMNIWLISWLLNYSANKRLAKGWNGAMALMNTCIGWVFKLNDLCLYLFVVWMLIWDCLWFMFMSFYAMLILEIDHLLRQFDIIRWMIWRANWCMEVCMNSTIQFIRLSQYILR